MRRNDESIEFNEQAYSWMKSHCGDWFDKHLDCFRIIILDILIWMIQFNKTLSQNIWIKNIVFICYIMEMNEKVNELKRICMWFKKILMLIVEREKRRMRLVI